MIPDTQTRPEPTDSSSELLETMLSGAQDVGVRSAVPAQASPRTRYRKRSFSMSRALTMLTLLPVNTTSVPRVHVEPRQPNGTVKVLDRFTGQQFIVYTPQFAQQFRGGHRSGRWYFRPVSDLGTDPSSQSFPSALGAIQGIIEGRWSLHPSPARGSEKQIRVVWPASGSVRIAAS
jgi:hypothetical protein